ncbi:MAG: biopolymer transporter ExbD [Hydrogenophilaceae bacterium]
MNFQRGVGRDEPEINLIPLIDVLLVILIFLMITTTYARFSELQINLPEAKGDSAKEVPVQIAVDVDATGNYRVDNVGLAGQDIESLADAMVRTAADRKDPVVVISADALATHQSVVRVMDAARRVGFTHVTFVTQTTASDSP